jgi:hypothetical protein
MKIRPVGAELFYADGRTDRRTNMKLTAAFRRFEKAPINEAENTMLWCPLCASFQILKHLNELHDACRYRYAIARHCGDIISNLTPY